MFKIFLSALLYLCVFVSFVSADPVPVMVELFSSSEGCDPCDDAEAQLRLFRGEFALSEYFPIIFPVDDSDPQATISNRANSFYKIKTKPTALFNGTSAVAGYIAPVRNNYRNNINNQLGRETDWQFRGEMRINDGILQSNIQVINDATPANPLDLNYAIMFEPETFNNFEVTKFNKQLDRFQTARAVASVTADVEEWGGRTDVAIVWFLQNPVSKNIEQARLFRNLNDIHLDINLDGFIDARDFMTFASIWKTENPLADFNNDAIVDAQDLLIMLRTQQGILNP